MDLFFRRSCCALHKTEILRLSMPSRDGTWHASCMLGAVPSAQKNGTCSPSRYRRDLVLSSDRHFSWKNALARTSSSRLVTMVIDVFTPSWRSRCIPCYGQSAQHEENYISTDLVCILPPLGNDPSTRWYSRAQYEENCISTDLVCILPPLGNDPSTQS
jgi:hypothetical protein